MNYRIFNIPIPNSENELERMNKFLGSIRIISIQKELVATGGSSYWSFVIEYYYENNNLAGRKNKIDYREVLSEEDFAVYSTLRELRKQIAEREGVPVYAVFTNEQLSEMVKKRVISKNMLSQIPGIGGKKVGSYADWFLPSYDELYLMNANLVVGGNHPFGTSYYVSSSEYDATTVSLVAFGVGIRILRSKDNSHLCRPARAF